MLLAYSASTLDRIPYPGDVWPSVRCGSRVDVTDVGVDCTCLHRQSSWAEHTRIANLVFAALMYYVPSRNGMLPGPEQTNVPYNSNAQDEYSVIQVGQGTLNHGEATGKSTDNRSVGSFFAAHRQHASHTLASPYR